MPDVEQTVIAAKYMTEFNVYCFKREDTKSQRI